MTDQPAAPGWAGRPRQIGRAHVWSPDPPPRASGLSTAASASRPLSPPTPTCADSYDGPASGAGVGRPATTGCPPPLSGHQDGPPPPPMFTAIGWPGVRETGVEKLPASPHRA